MLLKVKIKNSNYKLVDVKDILSQTSFEAFKVAKVIRAIVIPSHAMVTTRKIIDNMFSELFNEGVPIGVLHTRLAVPGMEHNGPALAAKKLFEILGK